MKNIKKIQGPVSLYEMKIPVMPGDKNPKHIYLFGDNHVRETTCDKNVVSIADFISDTIIQNSSKILDIYVESPYKSPYTSGDNYLFDVERIFNDCLLQKPSCSYKNTRFHFVDIRNGESQSFKILNDAYWDFIDVINPYIRNPQSFENPGLDLFKIIHRYEKTWIWSDFFYSKKELNLENPIQKEIRKSNISEQIIAFYKDCIDPKIRNLSDLMDKLLLETNSGPELENIDDWIYFLDVLFEVLACYVDIYTLLRIFRPFKVVPNRIRKEEPENIILYMGDAHIVKIVEFLKSIGGEIIAETHSDDFTSSFQCIDIKDFELPFFTN